MSRRLKGADVSKFLSLSLVLFISLLSLACSKVVDALDYLFCGRTTIAELDAGHQRAVVITADNCWELGRPIHYEIREAGRVVIPETYIGSDDGDESHDYAMVYAEGGALVGVLETTSKPAELVIMQDFMTGESWPRLRDDETVGQEPVERKWRERFERLRRENPNLPASL